ncbi:MAG: adenylate/guanylate cyclase domain-containing protein, partial [Nocardioides kribbensis]
MGDVPVLTSPELAEHAGVSLEQARRLWRALGFPEHPADEAAFMGADSEAVGVLLEVVRSGL